MPSNSFKAPGTKDEICSGSFIDRFILKVIFLDGVLDCEFSVNSDTGMEFPLAVNGFLKAYHPSKWMPFV